ncbi:molybdopterin-binding protein [Salinarimonas rosea]|uniref:molybdopterin-binding protein n=1 Tax=Salinarimonas rosea TaxID=552063 RepID=UPI00042913F1|nr:molybdopterin-binding protein [Salinarimonas rosea]
MIFATLPVREAVGALSVHSVKAPGVVLKKGAAIGEAEAAALAAAGVSEIVAVRLEPGDVGEDAAAARLAQAAAGEGLRCDAPFTGRVNLFSTTAGVLVADAAAVGRINAVDEAITVATLPAYAPVVEGEMVATVKIIPYAVPEDALGRAVAAAGQGALRIAPWVRRRIGVVSTLLPALKPTVVDKTLRVLEKRLAPTGARIVAETRRPHAVADLAEALGAMAAQEADLIVVFGASAIADRRDVIPAAIEAADGRVDHFGMPVDPGNLLLVGTITGRPVVGAPGCARSPKENGFDWVLHRLLAGLPVTRADIVAMGVGGLLMEIVSRPQPRGGEPSAGPEAAEDEP